MKTPNETKSASPKGHAKRVTERESKTGKMLDRKRGKDLSRIDLDKLKAEFKKLKREGVVQGPVLALAPASGRARALAVLENITGIVEKLEREVAEVHNAVSALQDALIAERSAEDAADAASVAHLRGLLASGDEEFIPAEVVDRLDAGESPVRVFREWRGMTQGQLAAAIAVDQSFISKIEAGTKHPTAANLGRLARALKIDADLLLPDA